MDPTRIAALLFGSTVIAIVAGCGRQHASLLAPERAPAGSSAAPSRLEDDEYIGGRICFFNASLDYCYPDPGYLATPDREVPVQVRAGNLVTMNWRTIEPPGKTFRASRWALDIDDLFDETPRIDESTDITHWSQWSPASPASATLGPWPDGEVHRLYVDVNNDWGVRSLGIVRFEVSAGANSPPDCSGATAVVSGAGRGGFAAVTIGGVADPDGDAVTIAVTGVTQDEPLNGGGDGNTCPDATLRDGVAAIRLERSGQGNGRVYTIAFTATDALGASCSGTVDVCVPHGGPNDACTKDALVVNSLESCAGPASRLTD